MINTFQHKICSLLTLFLFPLISLSALAQNDSIIAKTKQTTKVAIAYSIVPFDNISSAVSTIDASTIQKNAVTTIEESLNGTLPGLYSIKNGGDDFGARNYDFYVRGKATTGSATPLILIDDVEGNINLIDYNEVESVTVLKDAAALAIYGMRGANAVILIKTKRGFESKNVIGLDFRVGLQTPEKIRSTLNAYDYTTLYNEALTNDGSIGIYNPAVYKNNSNLYQYPDVNYANLFLKNQSLTQQYNFTARGGSKTAQYFFLVGYTKLDGLFNLPNNSPGINQKAYERYNFRSNIDVDLGSGFKMSVDVLAAFDYTRSPWIGASYDANASSNYLFNSLISTPANAFPITNPDGSLAGTSTYRDNPQGILLRGLRTDEHKQLTSKVNLSKDLSFITKGLKANLMYHFENYNASYKAKYKSFAVYQLDSASNTYSKYGTDDTKSTTAGGQVSYYRDNNFLASLNYERRFDNHDVNAVVLYNQIRSNAGGDVPDHVYQGVSGRLIYGYQKRYLAELVASYQGSNNYQSGKRYGFFPAVAVSWVASEEKFIQRLKFVDYFKIRASYGLNGNDQTGGNRFAYRQAWYAGSGYGFGNPNATSDGSYEGTLANTNATWEKSYKADLGIDFKTMKGDLSLTADVFYERREDIMVDQANVVPSLIGISLPLINGGTIENKGIEASLNYSKKIGEIGINLGGNFLFAQNKIIDLKELPYQYSWLYQKGNSIDTRYGFVATGIYNTAADLINAPASAYKSVVGLGDIRYVNQNPTDDQVINELDKVAIGNAFPQITYGVNLGVTYKSFDLSCHAEGTAMSTIDVRPGNFTVYALNNRWTSETSNDNYPKLSISDTHNTQTSTFWQESGDFFRISSVELGYVFPTSWAKKLALSSIRLYINANNLATFFSEREGRDPEALPAGFSEYPLLKTYMIGLSVKL